VTLGRGAPHFFQKAAACLDLSGLPANQQSNGSLLAIQLEAVLRARSVESQLLPDQVKSDVYVLAEGPGHRLALARMPDGRWLFDRDTVAQIPKMHDDVRKQLQDKNRDLATVNVSPDYASAQATFRTLVNAFRRQDEQRILACFDLGEIPHVAREQVGRQLANKLKQIIVRYRMPILQDIPDSNFNEPYVYLSRPEGVIELVRVPSGERKGEWVFSRDTVRSINALYIAFEDEPYLPEVVELGTQNHLPHPWKETELWLRSQMPAWLRFQIVNTPSVHLEVYELVGYGVVAALALVCLRLTTWLLAGCLQWWLARRQWILPRETLVRRLRPTGWLFAMLFLRWGVLVLAPDPVVAVPLLTVLNPLVWLIGMWAIFRLIDLVSDAIDAHLAAQQRRPEIAQMFWPVTSLVLKIILFVATLFRLMAMFSWDVTAVLTGLGIGGLAFALGAQDSLKNLFGSFTLIVDRPFVVGEAVKIGSHDQGVVEVVGLRSTRIRNADGGLLIVPNSNLTTMEVTNFGRPRYKRYHTRIGIVYATPLEKIAAFRDGIRDAIGRHAQTRKDVFHVALIDLAASAIEILVNVYFEVADRHHELAAREALIQDILRVADQLHVELAYPTQTIHLAPANQGPSNS
jgi:MscS family membrane protein